MCGADIVLQFWSGKILCSAVVRCVIHGQEMERLLNSRAQYPAYDSFLELVQEEAEQNVKRLRHHPSIVIFGESFCCMPLTHLTVCLNFQLEIMRVSPASCDIVILEFTQCHIDYQLAESLKLELDYADEKSDFRKTNFPARHIYERLLPSVVEKLCDIHYHRSSPYSGQGKGTNDLTLGDLHQCRWQNILSQSPEL